MQNKTVIVDLDGVVVDTLTNWLIAWNTLYGVETDVFLRRDMIQQYDFDRYVPASHRKAFFDLLDSCNIFEDSLPELGAIQAVRMLLVRGYDVVIATTVLKDNITAEQQKRSWLRRFLPEFNQDNLVFTKRKELLRGDALFEDREATINEWLRLNPDCAAYMIRQPYTPMGYGSLLDCVYDYIHVETLSEGLGE